MIPRFSYRIELNGNKKGYDLARNIIHGTSSNKNMHSSLKVTYAVKQILANSDHLPIFKNTVLEFCND